MPTEHTINLDYGLGSDIDMLRDTVRGLHPRRSRRAAEIDEKDEFPIDLWPAMGELGLHGITVKEEFGGADMGYLAHCVAMEEISRASAWSACPTAPLQPLCQPDHRWGTPEQKERYLPGFISGEHVGAWRCPAGRRVGCGLDASARTGRATSIVERQ